MKRDGTGDDGDMLRALVVLALVIPAFADDPLPEPHTLRSWERCSTDGLKRAEQACTRLIESDPLDDTAWHNRALIRRRLGDLKGALEDFDKALTLAPENAGLHNDLGLAKADSGDLAGAIASYDAALRLDPDLALAWNNRSFAKRLNGDADGALKDATMALQLNPNYARAYLNRGLCLYNLREWEDALADLEKSVSLESEGQDYTRLRIWILKARLGKKEAADGELREWLKGRKPRGDRVESYGLFLLGDVTEEALLAEAKGSIENIDSLRKSEGRFLAGSKAVCEGRLDDAQRHLEAAMASGMKNTEIIRSVEAELEGLREKK